MAMVVSFVRAASRPNPADSATDAWSRAAGDSATGAGWLTAFRSRLPHEMFVVCRGKRPQTDEATVVTEENSDWDIQDIPLAA